MRKTSCFSQNCFGASFYTETACNGWRMVDLQQKRNPPRLPSSKKAVEIPENKANIVPDINDHTAAVYDRRVYIGKVLETDNSDAKISFQEHAETLSIGSIFCKPKKKD